MQSRLISSIKYTHTMYHIIVVKVIPNMYTPHYACNCYRNTRSLYVYILTRRTTPENIYIRILYRYIMFGRGVCEKYQSRDEKFPQPNGFIFVFLTSGQDSGMQERIHFRTDMEHNICRPVNNSDVSLRYQFCKNIVPRSTTHCVPQKGNNSFRKWHCRLFAYNLVGPAGWQ